MEELISFNLPYQVKIIEKINKENMLNFSIVLVTRNNEERLSLFLDSIDEFINKGIETIILDIGSNDNTINIASQYNIRIEDGTSFLRVVDEEMSTLINNNFNSSDGNIVNNNDIYIDYSGARNYASSLSSNDMVLMIDINTNKIDLNLLEIEKLILDGYDRFIINKLGYKHNKTEFYNRKKHTWKNITCEILEEIENTEIKKLNINDYLLKYYPNSIYKENYLIGLSINCFLDQQNDKLSQIFAIELYDNQLYSISKKEFERHLTLSQNNIDRSLSLYYIGEILLQSSEILGIEYLHKSFIECSDRRIALFRLGNYFFHKRDFNKCITYLEACLTIKKSDNIDEDNFMYEDGPSALLYVAYWWIGDYKKGKYYFDKSIEINPFNTLYMNEAIFHYKYIGNKIFGELTFQNLQYLYNISIKYNSILEIYPENARGTHALINGCNGLVTVILNNEEMNSTFLSHLDYPGNLRILNMNNEDTVNFLKSETEEFDMVIISKNEPLIINDYNPYWGFLNWEKIAKKLLCGYNYNEFKTIIDSSFEISGNEDNIWFKNISSFEKTIVYKRKI